MQEMLEIREICKTPKQLLKSQSFERYLELYKNEFITELKKREDKDLKEELQHRITFIEAIKPDDFINIIKGATPFSGDQLRDYRASVQFLDGAFHHYRTKTYARLILPIEENSNGISSEAIKDKVSSKADRLSELILETRRILLVKVGFGSGIRRSQGLECHPNVAVGEISGDSVKLPDDYSVLKKVPVTSTADMRTGVYYTTHANKRAFPFLN